MDGWTDRYREVDGCVEGVLIYRLGHQVMTWNRILFSKHS